MSEDEGAVPVDELTTTDLRVGGLYGGVTAGRSIDPVSRLLGVGIQGGIRGKGSPTRDKTQLVALYSTGGEAEWPDSLDVRTGVLTYYGDNKTPGRALLDTNNKGNLILRNAFAAAAGVTEDRVRVPPFFYFERVSERGPIVRFCGLVVPGMPGAPIANGLREISHGGVGGGSANYEAKFTLLDESVISRQWLDALAAGDSPLSVGCPQSWREWVEYGKYRPAIGESPAPRELENGSNLADQSELDDDNLTEEGQSVARILKIVRSTQNIQPHKLENGVTCQYKVIDTDDGEVLVHLSTFGSDGRESPPKSSQSMQFDRERSAEIVQILRRAFRRTAEGASKVEPVFPDATDGLAEKLFVPKDWLQDCIELLRDRPQLIFYGPPGTGKTYLARKIAEHISGPDNVTIVQFHPSYSYEDFFEGFRPSKSGGGQLLYDVHDGPLKVIADEARLNPEKIYTLIIDEINRGNVAKIFGELYFLLEYRDKDLNLMYSDEFDPAFTLPDNIVIIGTMNTADRSIALLDSAMRRRFAFVSLHPSEEPTKGVLRQWLASNGYDTEAADLMDTLNSEIEDEDFKIGPSYFMRPAALSAQGIERTWRTSILPLLEEYHYGDRGIEAREKYSLSEIRRLSRNSRNASEDAE
ncbi:AAA family ATPase [Nocardia alni]|uniref:AAA family ATPase n=1 Tax=Nocardia alni TaxID=2815723 RepID=UPI001C22F99D|nr:AAA family ATPase [Nocardia alni]